MADLLDFSNPNTMGYIGLLSGLGQAAMPSRLPVPTGAVMGMAAQGLAQGQQQGLQNAMLWQRLNMMRNDPILNGSAFGQGGGAQAAPMGQSSQPAIPPSSGGALGSGTFGMPIGGQPAATASMGGAAAPAPAGGQGGIFGRLSPTQMFQLGYSHSMVGLPDGPELMKLAAQYDPELAMRMPTDLQRNAGAAYGVGTPGAQGAVRAAVDKEGIVSLRPGAPYAIGSHIYGTPPAAPAGYMNQPSADGSWSVVPVQGGAAAVEASAQAAQRGKSLGQGPFQSMTLHMSDGTTVDLSPIQWEAYQRTGQLPVQAGGAPAAAPASAAAPGASAPPVTSANTDTAQILQSELTKAQDRLQNWRQYMSPNELMRDPQGAQFRARAQSDVTALQRELQRSGGAAPAPAAAGAAPVLGRSAPPGLPESQRASQVAPSEQMKKDYDTMAASGPQSQQSLEYLDHMLQLAKNKPFYMGLGVGGIPGMEHVSTDAAEYEKARASYISAQGKALGSSGTDASRATIEQAVPEYGKPQDAMIRGLTDQRNQLVIGMLRRQLLAPVYQRGDEKGYTALANGFDQNVAPSMVPLLTMPAGKQRAEALKAAAQDASMRARLEWAAQNGLLK